MSGLRLVTFYRVTGSGVEAMQLAADERGLFRAEQDPWKSSEEIVRRYDLQWLRKERWALSELDARKELARVLAADRAKVLGELRGIDRKATENDIAIKRLQLSSSSEHPALEAP